jgi:hypothetical protein
MSVPMYRFATTLAALLLGGCASSQLSLSIKAPPGTNLGRPMYMLVRQVDPKQYANEAYSEVAARVGAPDDTVLQTAVIYPGTIQRFQVKTPKEGAVAVSFLFTAPDGNWQLLLGGPQAQSAVDIELTVSRILSDSSPPALPTEAPAAPEAPEAPKGPEMPKMELPKLPGAA